MPNSNIKRNKTIMYFPPGGYDFVVCILLVTKIYNTYLYTTYNLLLFSQYRVICYNTMKIVYTKYMPGSLTIYPPNPERQSHSVPQQQKRVEK